MVIPKESEIEFEDPEMEETINQLEQWGKERNLEFQLVSEVGFGRDCIGFLDKRVPFPHFVDYNPVDEETLEVIEGLYDDRLRPPKEVIDAYHKFDCLCVLRHHGDGTGEGVMEGFKTALKQMKAWTDHLDSLGWITTMRYKTGHTGEQAIISGEYGYALKIVSE